MTTFSKTVLSVANAEWVKWQLALANPIVSQQDILKKYLSEFGYSPQLVDDGAPPYWCALGTNWVKRESAQQTLSEADYRKIETHLPNSAGVRHVIDDYKEADAFVRFSGKAQDVDEFRNQLVPGGEVFLGRIGHDRRTATNSPTKHTGILSRVLNDGKAIEVIDFNGVDSKSVGFHYWNQWDKLPDNAKSRAKSLLMDGKVTAVRNLFAEHGVTYSGGVTKTIYYFDDAQNNGRDNNRVILGFGNTDKLLEHAARKAGVKLAMDDKQKPETRFAYAEVEGTIPPETVQADLPATVLASARSASANVIG